MNNSVSLSKYSEKYFGKYLDNSEITEICYNGDNKIWFLQNGKEWECEETELNFDGAMAFSQAAAAFKEDQIDKARPILSCVLVNGERVQIILPPATKNGYISITIRKPNKEIIPLDNYEKNGVFSEIKVQEKTEVSPKDIELLKLYENCKFMDFCTKAVEYGKNIVICGETGSGKTTFMKSLMQNISPDERIVTIEDVEEIAFKKHKNFVQLFYPSEAKSGDFLNSATLLKSCLRMKPDRILLAELRGAETYDFVNVLTSGHGGSITSCHAGSSEDAFKRLAMMILQNPQGQCVPYEIIQKMLFDTIDIIIHIYAHKGIRRIGEIYFKENKVMESKNAS